MTYADLNPRAVPIEAFGLTTWGAPFGDVLAAKLALGRPQDLVAERELRRVARLLTQGERPDYGLEAFAARA